MVQQYDFVARVREEVELLQRELGESGVSEGIRAMAERLQLPDGLALAALYRSAKRSGYTLKLLTEELKRQLEAEAASELSRRKER